jgi:two-component system chemotaxis response regulator CheB
MARQDIVVIGASAGGMEALQELAARLPRDLDASLFVVWHMPPGLRSVLPQVLSKVGSVPAEHAQDRQKIERRRIYVAPADHHMLLEEGYIRIARGPRENRFRPAVDPLFRSAAYVYGPRVIGVVLTGALDDGTAGLWTIKMRGGTAIVQDPDEAMHPSMPLNALQNVEVDYKATLSDIARLLGKLTREEAPRAPDLPMEEKRKLEAEIRIAEQEEAMMQDILGKGELSPFTCPECHGVLARMQEGRIMRFRCHTGHAFSADTLLSSLTEQVEARLWDAVRAVDETVMLLNHMGEHLARAGHAEAAERYRGKAKEALDRTKPIREAAQSAEQFSANDLRKTG